VRLVPAPSRRPGAHVYFASLREFEQKAEISSFSDRVAWAELYTLRYILTVCTATNVNFRFNPYIPDKLGAQPLTPYRPLCNIHICTKGFGLKLAPTWAVSSQLIRPHMLIVRSE
jgi:hypothetical protein